MMMMLMILMVREKYGDGLGFWSPEPLCPPPDGQMAKRKETVFAFYSTSPVTCPTEAEKRTNIQGDPKKNVT